MRKNIALLCLSILVLSSCVRSKEKVFEQEAKELNRMYPMMIDQYTQIDSVKYSSEGNSFYYFYTLKGDADRADIAGIKYEELQKQLPLEIKHAPGMKVHRDHQVTMVYVYHSESSSNELFRITVTPDLYK